MSYRRYGRLRFKPFPGYNWCGPGCNGPEAPTNELDAACKKHDICYQKGRSPCECDEAFIRRIRPLTELDCQQGRHARIFYHYMKLQKLVTCRLFRDDRDYDYDRY